jgi:DNA repair protein RadD
MPIQARDYQVEAVQSVFTYFRDHFGNPLVAMPTGTGKSVVIAELLRAIYHYYPGERVMVLTHVKELIEQNFLKLLDAWPQAPAGVYSAGLGRRDTLQKIIFAGIASVAKRYAEFGHVGLLFIDEAHLVGLKDETMYQQFIAGLKLVNPAIKVVGFTATPWRLGHGKITENGGLFTDICFDITGMHAFNRLLDEGYLCPLIPKQTTAKLDTDGVHMRGGEFISSELQAAVDKSEVTYAALKESMELGHDRHSWLVFCAGVDHAKHTADMLNQMGITAVAIHSDMAAADRDAAVRDWKSGKYRAAVNNNVLTTGVDHPKLDMIIMLRPTASAVLWVQMLGRGTRPVYADGYDLSMPEGRLEAIRASQKQNCLVLDFAGNARRLGPINDPVIPRRKGEKSGDAPIKVCPACSTYNHASARHCICCGGEFPQYGPKIKAGAATDDLIKPSEMPVVNVFRADHITYSAHHKAGKPPMMKVSYYCGLKMFQEFVCFEHPDPFSQRKARAWWRERQPGQQANQQPATTEEALKLAPYLKAPTHLRVWTNKRYPEILGFDYSGTAFNTQEADAAAVPTASVAAAPPPMHAASAPGDMDDDIPF